MTPWDELVTSLGLTPSTPTPRTSPSACHCRGTRTAYQQHLRRNEDPCPKSRAANAAYQRKLAGSEPRTRPECGTYGGYQAHAKRGEGICWECAEARRKRDRDAYAARKACTA